MYCLTTQTQSPNLYNIANFEPATYATPYTYSPPRSHLSTASMDSGVESPSHSANNQQHLTDDSQGYINYQQPIYNNSTINTSNYQNILPNTFTISFPTEIGAYELPDSKRYLQAQLVIVEEPKTIFRFRYETEMQGPHGMIQARQHNKNQKVFPTVALRNFDGNESVRIRCTLHQYKNENDEEVDFLHPHKLIMRSGEIEKSSNDPHYIDVGRQNDFTAVFQGLGIIQTKRDQQKEVFTDKLMHEKEFEVQRCLTEEEQQNIQRTVSELVKKKININQVRLGYTAYIKNELNNTWTKLCGPVFSSVINNKKSGKVGDLKICRMSTYWSEADGNQEVFMFVSKVDKHTIKVRFYSTKDGDPDGEEDWQAEGRFSPSDVHHQFGIVLRTPPYKDRQIDKPKKVFIQLCRSSDGERSDPLEFEYRANARKTAKRPRFESPNIPAAVEDYETATSRNFLQSNSTSFGNASYSNQFFQSGSNNSSSNQQHHEEEETEAEFNVILQIVAQEFSTDKLAESELMKYVLDTENNFELVIDAAEPGKIDPIETELSLLEKLKMTIKLFKDCYGEEKIREMMMTIIKAAEERDENSLIDIIQFGTLHDIKELVLILVKYKMFEVLQSKNDIDQNAIHLSILMGYTNLVKMLIKCGVNVNEADAFGVTPLHLAVKNNSTCVVRELLAADGIALNALDDDGNSPLILSVMNNNLEIAKLLINAGANVSVQNPTSGFTCLHAAISNKIISREIIYFLIELDESLLAIESNNNETVLKMAKAYKLPQDITDHLSAFYNDDDEGEVFDEECLNTLCAIFDDDDNWQVWAIRMDLAVYIKEWFTQPSPSRALFQHLLSDKKNLQDFVELFDLCDDDERDSALNAINEMAVRKFSE